MMEQPIRFTQKHFSPEIIKTLQILRDNHGYEKIGERIEYWNYLVSVHVKAAMERKVFQNRKMEVPADINADLIVSITTLMLSMIEYFDCLSIEPDTELSEFNETFQASEAEMLKNIKERDNVDILRAFDINDPGFYL